MAYIVEIRLFLSLIQLNGVSAFDIYYDRAHARDFPAPDEFYGLFIQDELSAINGFKLLRRLVRILVIYDSNLIALSY